MWKIDNLVSGNSKRGELTPTLQASCIQKEIARLSIFCRAKVISTQESQQRKKFLTVTMNLSYQTKFFVNGKETFLTTKNIIMESLQKLKFLK